MTDSISMDDFKQRQRREKLNIIDVRRMGEFSSGHIPGAINIPLSEIAQHLDKIDIAEEYHVVCLSGARSSVACELLGHHGFKAVNVRGGMSAWSEGTE